METPSNPTSVNHRIREGLARVAMAIRGDDWNRARVSGLNPTQLFILELLKGRKDGLAVKAIAANLGVTQPTATDSIAALERKGLVVKTAGAADRRGVNVSITDDGHRVLATGSAGDSTAEAAVDALAQHEQEDLLLTLIKMIRQLQEARAIPIQRMCTTCRYFVPFRHPDAAQPHHCNFVDAAFGQQDIRIECREHETADPSSRAATWDAFQQG